MEEIEYQHFFENADEQYPIYKVQVLNNLKPDSGFFYNSRLKCEFCGQEHSGNCDFSFSNKEITVKDII